MCFEIGLSGETSSQVQTPVENQIHFYLPASPEMRGDEETRDSGLSAAVRALSFMCLGKVRGFIRGAVEEACFTSGAQLSC